MYRLEKTSEKRYKIFIRDTEIGSAIHHDGKWTAEAGRVYHSNSTLKKAVENVLYNIIMNQVGRAKNEQKRHKTTIENNGDTDKDQTNSQAAYADTIR
jgi:hypothetical protein